MDDIAGKIQLYHNLFLGCLCLAVLCLILAATLFFAMDIRSVLGYLTGRQAKKKIRELEAANAVSGRLTPRERSSMQYVAQDMKTDMGIRQQAVPGARKVEKVVEESPPKKMSGQDTGLSSDGPTEVLEGPPVSRGRFFVERELILIHTEEVI